MTEARSHECIRLLLRAVGDGGANFVRAESLIRTYASTGGVFEADADDVVRQCGIPRRTAQLMALMPGLARRYMRDACGASPILDREHKAAAYARSLFWGVRCEQFFVISLDAQYRLVEHAMIQRGTVSELRLHPRMVVEAALKACARAVILAHNHPGGACAFSVSDLDSTRVALKVFAHIGIPVLDHLLVAGGDVAGMRRLAFFSGDVWPRDTDGVEARWLNK